MMNRLFLALLVVSIPVVDAAAQAPAAAPAGPVRRLPDGKPDLNGFFQSDAGGANYGLEKHPAVDLTPPGRGVIIDPPDGKLPIQPWAKAEQLSRDRPERGYDDPTAHCFVGGVPRSLYVPAPFHIVQTSDSVVFLHERMAWRTVSLDRKEHLPDSMRLWQGDSIGRWEGDTLVIETTNFYPLQQYRGASENLKVTERLTRNGPDTILYRFTIDDPTTFTAPWTGELVFNRFDEAIYEYACHEGNYALSNVLGGERAKEKRELTKEKKQ
jgi:hypothetical protein